MRFRLSYKILAVFFLLTVLSVILAVGILRYFAAVHFEQYIRRKNLVQAERLVPVLGDFYARFGSWEPMRRDRRLWRRLLRASRVDAPTDEGDAPAEPRNGRHEPPQDRMGPRHGPGNQRAPLRDPFRLAPRIALFDGARRPVVGPAGPPEGFSLLPIEVDGRTAGWIGLKHLPRPAHPADRDFLQRQFRVFYLVGGVLLLLSAAVALLLSRNLLTPVRRLAQGTRALAERRFDTRIRVTSSDELGQLARDFNTMAAQLEAYETRQKQWLADIAHELRTPLAVIIGEIEALQDGVRRTDPAALSSLHAEAGHIQQIVQQLHDLAMADAGAMTMRFERTDPLEVLAEVAGLFRERLAGAGLDLETVWDRESAGPIDGDRDRLRQVFTNLCENALQHAAAPGRLTIRARRTAGSMRIDFEDTGPGVPPEALDHLFDRLYRVDTARSRVTGGSGLGLAICQSIVAAHGGSIRAVDGDAGGLRIEIALPVAGDRGA